MKVMGEFKNNRNKILELKDDVILFIEQINNNSFGVFSSEYRILFRSGRRVTVKYITSNRIELHNGLFQAYLGTKKEELKGITVDEFVKELRDFGSESGYNTSVIV